MGIRVSLTLLALAHASMMSREASWIGFFMYPTLISRSWAWVGVRAASDTPAVTRAAATPRNIVRRHRRDGLCMSASPANRLAGSGRSGAAGGARQHPWATSLGYIPGQHPWATSLGNIPGQHRC